MRAHVLLAASAVTAAFAMFGAAPVFASDVAFNIGATNNYVFRGLTQTDEKFAVQGGLDFATDGGFYAGAWASNVDFKDGTDAEIDLYGGYRTEAAGFAWDVGVIAYTYVGAPSGVSYNNYEVKVGASRAFGPATIGATLYYSPDSWGVENESLYAELTGAYTVSDKISISGAVGRQTFDPGSDYTTWNAGGTYALTDKLGLDLRYYDTNLHGYDDAFVVSLKASF
ncbi:TorF family putative porin [Brevundimonas sp.]|uniref:TorF family putative porin n=1 Tax=Brevundimonas sp. TaxID=1871086 RepID=UPI0025C5F63D|nr:TorF family putative porin [Brevundimonas sp.]